MSFGSSLKSILAPTLPFLATAIGGPFGPAASAILSKVLGTKPGATDQEMTQAWAMATPDQINQAKAEEDAFKIKMTALNISSMQDLEKIFADDRANARDMQKTTRSKTLSFLAIGTTVGFFGLIVFIAMYGIKPDVHDIVIGMTGMLATGWVTVMSFYFGSSKGSEDKNELLARATLTDGK